MVLIVKARDNNNTCSIRIWWQREFFRFVLFCFQQQKLRRSRENDLLTTMLHFQTAFKVKSQ